MLKNMMLLLISLTVALAAGEAMLRMFTPFPIGTQTHRSIDERYGYRLDRRLATSTRMASGIHLTQIVAFGSLRSAIQ